MDLQNFAGAVDALSDGSMPCLHHANSDTHGPGLRWPSAAAPSHSRRRKLLAARSVSQGSTRTCQHTVLRI